MSAALDGPGTPAVSDALDRLGLDGACFGIMPLFDAAACVGPAFTVRYRPAGPGGGTVGDFLDDVPPGAIVAIDNAGRTDCTVWGDIMTTLAVAKRLGGTVIDGVCRDVAKPLAEAYPMFTRDRFMLTGKDRVTCAEIGGSVTIGRTSVATDDVLVADGNGCVRVPAGRLDEVAELAHRIHDVEVRIVADVAAGAALRDARAAHGYHALQRKPS